MLTVRRISLELKAETAVFLHSSPDGPALWRAAPFRGAARWWARALLGGADPSPDNVRGREAEIFGTSEKASPVIFRIDPGMSKDTAEINPAKQKSEGSKNALKTAFKRNSVAKLQLLLAPCSSPNPKCLDQAYASLWLALNLGGVGQRSRRGAGSLKIVSAQGDVPGGLEPITSHDPAQFASALGAGLRKAREIFGLKNFCTYNTGTFPPFPILHPAAFSSYVVKMKWKGDETQIRKELMEFRRRRNWHEARAKEPQFGMIGKERLSSPLIISIASIDEKGTLLLVTLFRHEGAQELGANWNKVEEFITTMRNEALASAEVKLT